MRGFKGVLAVAGLSFSLGGCGLSGGILADSATTYHAISSGVGVEANPVLPQGAVGAAVVSAGLKLAVTHGVKHFAPEACVPAYRGTTAVGWGAAANNLAVIAGSSGVLPVAVGLGVGAVLWQQPALEQQAVKFCGGSGDDPAKNALYALDDDSVTTGAGSDLSEDDPLYLFYQ